MAPQSHRRQVLLFFAAVLLPCVALLALGLRLVVQERELARARLEDEQRRVIRQLHRDLAAQLERTALRQATALSANPDLLHTRAYDDSAIVLVARVSNGQLILPWEQVEQSRDFRALLEQGEFGERLRRGEQAEFASENPGSAVEQYRQALGAADHSVQEAHARLYLARALDKAGQQGNATTEYQRLATLAPEVVDDNGIPFSLYASRQLLRSDPVDPGIGEAIQSVLSTDHWLTPGAVYLLRDLADTLLARASDPSSREAASRLAEDVVEHLALTEQALSLKSDFPSLGMRIPNTDSENTDTRWVSYGDPPWFVGAPPVGDRADGLVVAIHSDYVLSSVEGDVNAAQDEVGKVSITRRGGPEEEVLGASFPGLFVQFAPFDGRTEDQIGNVRWWFYSVGLLLVFGVTFFGAYLLWRDVRREVQLAETRSRFVAAVSHELKTPLTAIRMFAETLHEGESQDRDTQKE
ncbi:MAG: histidine kinase dimerization/phospho-acceptor domain-containing protein, partial [Gemmatimonadota bacterium]